MFCDRCGHELMEGDLFCPNCGQKVEPIEPAVPVEPEEPVEPASFFNVVKDSDGSGSGASYGGGASYGDGASYGSESYHEDNYSGGYGGYSDSGSYGGGASYGGGYDDGSASYGGGPSYSDGGASYGGSSEFYSEPGKHEDKQSFDKFVEMAAGGIGFVWLFVLLMSILNRIVLVISNALYYTYPFGSFFNGLYMALYYVVQALSWLAIIAGAAVAVGLIYKLTQKKPGESNQMLLVGIIDAAIVMLVGIMYRVMLYQGGYAYGPMMFAKVIVIIGGIASVIIGIDLFLKVFIEKDGLGGNFNLADDIDIIKSKFAKADTSDTSHYTDTSIPLYEMTVEHESKDSYFDGAGVDLFVKRLLLFLITMVTCGLGAPFMLASIEKWKKEHTVIEGRRLTFNGTGGQLFIKCLIWVLLSSVTCGIYALFIQTEYCKWMLKHTAYEGAVPINEEFPESFFDGTVGESIGNQILNYLITSLTCGLGLPWGRTMILRWEKKGSVISRDRLFYDGDGSGMFKEYIIVWLLSLVTCGIYSPWGEVRIEKYVINHTHIDSRWTY